ncbi:hypothetical protein [Parasitella parasitica]|uniref:Uncharacterized protein n=1 Tax=Parasitella parasitica TaxID=35722 RepID=A0A0B7MYM0_9FUNG|nr:hypothetical protein [Parasitella parasitica]
MLLRNEGLQYLNFSDCFSTIIPAKQHRGTQETIAVIFYMDKGKVMKQNDFKFACAMRHEDIFRCPVSAFAFFLLNLFQNGAPFLKKERWQYWKQYTLTKKIFVDHGVHMSKVTHCGRHAGSQEAQDLNIPIDIIKQGGSWKDHIGRLETNYLGKLPSAFARGMAGFWEKPFFLQRDTARSPKETGAKLWGQCKKGILAPFGALTAGHITRRRSLPKP